MNSSNKKPPIQILQKSIQRKAFKPSAGVIQPKYAVDSYVTVRSGGRDWYGVVKKHLHNGYTIRIGGGADTDTVDVPEENVHPHPSFAGRYEVHRDGASVRTNGGRWTARRYNSVMGRLDPSVRGAYIELEFLPNATVNATRIVLIQTVKATKDGAPYYVNDDGTDWVRMRSVEGVSIDQAPKSVSPEYVADPNASPLEFGGVFGGAPVHVQGGSEAGAHGSRIDSHPEPAWLRDKPHLRNVTGLSSQVFETTAVAADGPDRGKYYGSVSWGWIWRGGGERVELFPLEVVSLGAVSERFVAAAKRWNSVLSSRFVDTIKIPLPTG